MTQLDKKQVKWIEKKICEWYGEKCEDMKGEAKIAWEFVDTIKKVDKK